MSVLILETSSVAYDQSKPESVEVCVADRELELLRDSLREHVSALTVDIGPRTPLNSSSLSRAAKYIRSMFEDAGLSVKEQGYQYHSQRVTNVLAMHHSSAGAAAYYVVGAHYDTVPGTPGADDNASFPSPIAPWRIGFRTSGMRVL